MSIELNNMTNQEWLAAQCCKVRGLVCGHQECLERGGQLITEGIHEIDFSRSTCNALEVFLKLEMFNRLADLTAAGQVIINPEKTQTQTQTG